MNTAVLKIWIVYLTLMSTFGILNSQEGPCNFVPDQSIRTANYDITCRLDTSKKMVICSQNVQWINPSTDTIHSIPFYLYINAFKNNHSTFLQGVRGDVFGQNIYDRTEEQWGYIDIKTIFQASNSILESQNYIHPDDDNKKDQSLVEFQLNQYVLPGDTLNLTMEFEAKLPKLFVRAGYSRDHFYHFTHWFPQVTVKEKDQYGDWKWNSHQFHRRTEFFSDFGNYRVEIEMPSNLVVEGTGCYQVLNEENGNKTVEFYAEDVIDFAWVAYPHFVEYEDSWNGVDIKFVVAEEHECLIPRFLHALKFSLQYLDKHVGPYPYPSITVMDPPVHALRSGFMEYPMYITLGSFRYFPKNLRSIESLVVHEFAHQYFMATVASNEKEEAWMDEGFVTYFEDRIMEAMFGQHSSLVELGFFKVSNSSLTRDEYTSLPDPSVISAANPGWKIPESFKGLIYAKTATVLKSFEKMIGVEMFDQFIQKYYKKFSFKHPDTEDFFLLVKKYLNENKESIEDTEAVYNFLDQMILGTDHCDFAVTNISHYSEKEWVGYKDDGNDKIFFDSKELIKKSAITIRRLGGVIVPIDVEIHFDDGTAQQILWSGKERVKIMEFDKIVTTCIVDPSRKLWVDIDLTNNALSHKSDRKPLWTASSQVSLWIQNIMQSLSFLI